MSCSSFQQMAAGMQEQLDFKDKIIDRVAKSNKDKDRLISVSVMSALKRTRYLRRRGGRHTCVSTVC